jgi:hypothetical protein
MIVYKPISAREERVLRMVCSGAKYREVGAVLFCGPERARQIFNKATRKLKLYSGERPDDWHRVESREEVRANLFMMLEDHVRAGYPVPPPRESVFIFPTFTFRL